MASAWASAGVVGCAAQPHEGAVERFQVDTRPIAARVALPERYSALVLGEVTIAAPTPASLGASGRAIPGAGAESGHGSGRESDAGDEDGDLAVDPTALRASLARLLEASGCFRSVQSDPAEASGAGASGAGAPVDAASDAAAAADAAAPSGLRLDAHFRQVRLRRDAAEDPIIGSVFGYLFLGWLLNWLPDHTYELRWEPELVLRDPAANRVVARIAGKPRRASTTLNFVERRPQALPFAATVAWWPSFAFESSSSAVTELVAPLALREPLAELCRQLPELGIRHRLEVVRERDAPSGIKLEILAPTAAVDLAEPLADVEMRIAVHPSLGRLEGIVLGDRRAEAHGAQVRARFPATRIPPGGVLELRVELTQGPPRTLARLRFVEGLGRIPPAKPAAPPASAATPAKRRAS